MINPSKALYGNKKKSLNDGSSTSSRNIRWDTSIIDNTINSLTSRGRRSKTKIPTKIDVNSSNSDNNNYHHKDDDDGNNSAIGKARHKHKSNSKSDREDKEKVRSRKSKNQYEKSKQSLKMESGKSASNNRFQTMWLESQRASKKDRRVYVYVLISLWLSVSGTFIAKPWKHIAHRIELDQISLESIQNTDQSHILLCKAVLELEENIQHQADEPNNKVVIEEDRRVCLDRNNPFASLLQIFASSLIAQTALSKKLGLEYHHLCNPRHSSTSSESKKSSSSPVTPAIYSTIQETLRSNLLSNHPVDSNVIHQLCRRCIHALEDDDAGEDNNYFHSSGPECILFPFTKNLRDIPMSSENNPQQISQTIDWTNTEMFEVVLPSILKNLHESADQWDFTTTETSHILREVNERKNITTAMDPNTIDDAIIYLSCANEHIQSNGNCEVLVLPYYVYAKEIPSTVQKITVLASTACAVISSSCSDYGGGIQLFLNEWYPRATVEFEIAQSSMVAYSKMIHANHLICVISTSCILPALANDAYATLIESQLYYPWLPLLKRNFFGNVKILPHNTPNELTEGVTRPFLMQNPTSRVANCKELRGRLGDWVQDMKYAEISQYKLPVKGYAGAADINFQPNHGMIFREPTTYKWVEKSFPMCSLDYLKLDTLCAALDVLMIDRIFILGDSLSLQMAQSLWKLLGFLDDYAGDRDYSAIRKVQCPAPYTTDFEIAFSRNDRLMEVETGPTGIGDKNCKYGYCWPFVEWYKSSPGRTLLIANTGAHSHQHSIFYDDFDAFIELVDSLGRPNDLVWFRTSVPGHKDCDVKDLKPFKNYDEYVPTITEVYSWDKFIDYNDYASRVLRLRAKHGIGVAGDNTRPSIDILDVYPMTVLRPDGHAGGADCINCDRDDCLHYSLPGPVDWWNHLMLSNLVDIASQYI